MGTNISFLAIFYSQNLIPMKKRHAQDVFEGFPLPDKNKLACEI
jgi:hypothetical protein